MPNAMAILNDYPEFFSTHNIVSAPVPFITNKILHGSLYTEKYNLGGGEY
jgi:hypothetical protein